MSGIETTGSKRLVLVSGRAHPELAEQIAEELGPSSCRPTRAPSRTARSTPATTRACAADAFVIQSHTSPINEWLMEQLIMIDALKRASAKRITVVSRSTPTPGRTRRVAAASRSRPAWSPTSTRPPAPTASCRSTCTPRRSRASSTARRPPVRDARAARALQEARPETLTVVSPDMGQCASPTSGATSSARPRDHPQASRPAWCRTRSRCTRSSAPSRAVCLLVDDLIDTGRTIVKAAEALKRTARSASSSRPRTPCSNPASRSCSPSHRPRRRHRHAAGPRREALGPPDRAAHRACSPAPSTRCSRTAR